MMKEKLRELEMAYTILKEKEEDYTSYKEYYMNLCGIVLSELMEENKDVLVRLKECVGYVVD